MRLSTTCLLLLPVLLLGCKKDPEPPKSTLTPLTFTTVRTLTGSGVQGYADGPSTSARFNGPEGAAVDAQGNVYVADASNYCIRKVTPAGLVSTFAGTNASGYADGPAASAQFAGPLDVVLDSKGNLYVADGDNYCIRKITPAGVVSTFAGSTRAGFVDGPASTARFGTPNGLAIDAQDNLYVSDYDNSSIRKVTPAGVVSTLAGNGQRGSAEGQGAAARFNGPEGLAVGPQGELYVAEFDGARVRKVTPGGLVSTLAGNGTRGNLNGSGNQATIGSAAGVAVDAQGTVYVADAYYSTIRRITADGTVSTLAGIGTAGITDGPVATAQLTYPGGLALDATGRLVVPEYSQRIRTISAQ